VGRGDCGADTITHVMMVKLCCSELQFVAVCRSVLQCVIVCCSVSQCVAVCHSVLQYVVVCCSLLQCVAVCFSVVFYSVLKRVVACCSWGHNLGVVLEFICIHIKTNLYTSVYIHKIVSLHTHK